MATTANFQNFLEGQVRKTRDGLNNAQKDAMWRQLVNVKSTKKLTERDIDIEDMGLLSFVPEMGEIPQIDFNEGFAQAYRQEKWAAKILIPEEIEYFQREDLVDEMRRRLQDAAPWTQEQIIAYYYEYGDVAQASAPTIDGQVPMVKVVGGDGRRLFDNSGGGGQHFWKSDNVLNLWSNKSSSSDDLTESALNTMYVAIRRWKNSAGRPLNVKVTDLLIPPNLKQKAVKVLESRLEPATAVNAKNTAGSLMTKASYKEWQYLASTTVWYGLTDAKDGGICVYEGMPPTPGRGRYSESDNIDFLSVRFFWAHGCNRMRHYKVA